MQNKFLQIDIFPFQIILVSLLFMGISSCKIEEDTKPQIAFLNAPDFVFQNDSLAHGDSLKIGIICNTKNPSDRLRKFNISKSDNNLGDSTIQQINLPEGNNQNFNYTLRTMVANKSGNNRKYTFTILSESGKFSQINLTIKTKHH